MTLTLNWTYLCSFQAVAREGSLSAAARTLGASQPTIGRHIEALESQLDAPLFDRTGRDYRLTDLGLEIAEQADQMQATAETITGIAAGQSRTLSGTVRITASEIISIFILPELLTGFREQYPDIAVEILASDRPANLLSREADLAIRLFRPDEEDLITRKVTELSLGAYAHIDYLDRCGRPAGLDDYPNHTLIGGDRNRVMLEVARSLGISLKRDDFALRSDSFAVQWRAICAGYGIGFCQTRLAESEPGLERVLPDLLLPGFPVWLTAHKDLRTNRRLRTMFDFLARAFSDL